MGSSRGSFKGPFKGIYRGSIRVQGLGSTWRFMASSKWGYKSRNMGYNYSYPTYNPTYN